MEIICLPIASNYPHLDSCLSASNASKDLLMDFKIVIPIKYGYLMGIQSSSKISIPK